MIVGSIAGVLACVGFFNLQSYGGYSADNWSAGSRPAPSQQFEANAVPPERSGTQSAQPDGSNAATYQSGLQPEQSYAPADPQQGYAPPQQGYAPPQQGYAPPQQEYGPPQQGDAPTDPQAPDQQPYR